MNLFTQDAPKKVLRDHQSLFIDGLRAQAKKGRKRIIGTASVGFGKTLIAATLFKGSYEKGRLAMFTVPRNALIEPTAEEFEGQGLTDIGIIQANHPRTNPHARLQIASIHTAVNRDIPIPDLCIVDEVHLNTPEFEALLDSEAWKDVLVIGLSATPWKKGMGLKWGEPVQTKTCAQLIDEGYLVRPRYFVGQRTPDIAQYKTYVDKDGNRVLHEKDESKAFGAKEIIGDVVQTWLKHGENRPTFCYAVSLDNAEEIRKEFEKEGISCGYVDGSMSRNKRERVLKAYRSGHLKVIVNYGVLTTGIDEDVRCISIVREIHSEIDWVQIIGRGLRTDNPSKRVAGMEPKIDCIVIDHGNNLTRDKNAMPPAEDIYHDHLDTSDPKDKSKKAFDEDEKPPTHRKCKQCGGLIPPKTKKCPVCGFESEWKSVVSVNAEFVEFKKGPKPTMDEKQEFYSELLGIAHERGYQDGWVAHQHRKKWGTWPRGLQRVAKTPSSKVRKFVQQEAKKFYESTAISDHNAGRSEQDA